MSIAIDLRRGQIDIRVRNIRLIEEQGRAVIVPGVIRGLPRVWIKIGVPLMPVG